MLTLPLKQKRRHDFKPQTAGSDSEVVLILGEPTPQDLSSILRWGAISSRRRRQRRLLIFASDLHELSESTIQTHHVDTHVLSECLAESSGFNSQCPNQVPGEAMYLVGVLERASQFAVAWRADAERSTRDGQLRQGNPQSSSRHSAHSSHLSDDTHVINNRPNTNYSASFNAKLRSPRDHRYPQSNLNSKPTVTKTSSKGLLPKFLSFSSPTVPHLTSHLNPTSRSHNQRFPDTYCRTFDTILNFLPPDMTEKSLLKQVILLSTLCGQYFAQSIPEIPPFGPPSRDHFPFPSTPYSQNLKERANSLSFRTPTTEFKAGEAQRTSTVSSGHSSAPGSASPARSSTRGENSRSTTVSDTQPRRWSMLSWLSTTSTSQTSDPEPGNNANIDTCINTNTSQKKTIELRRGLSFLFDRPPKKSESVLDPSHHEGEESNRKRRSTKAINVQQTSNKHAYLIHVLPTSWVPTSLPTTESPADSPPHAHHCQRTENEHESLEKKRNSSPLLLSLDRSTEPPTRSFTHARMQTSLIRRATLQQVRLHNLERRSSLPTARVERAASRTILNPMVRGLRRNPVQEQSLQREKPPLAGQLENFLYDHFGQGNGDVLPFIFDAGVFGREVGMNLGKEKGVLVGEAVLSGLLDDLAMNRQCWVGEENLRSLVDHINVAHDEEETEGPEAETVPPLMGPKHPPLAAISPSSSEGSEGAGPAATPSSQRRRARAISDFEPPVLSSKQNVVPLPGTATKAPKSPEPAHMFPPSRPPASSRLVTTSAPKRLAA